MVTILNQELIVNKLHKITVQKIQRNRWYFEFDNHSGYLFVSAFNNEISISISESFPQEYYPIINGIAESLKALGIKYEEVSATPL